MSKELFKGAAKVPRGIIETALSTYTERKQVALEAIEKAKAQVQIDYVPTWWDKLNGRKTAWDVVSKYDGTFYHRGVLAILTDAIDWFDWCDYKDVLDRYGFYWEPDVRTLKDLTYASDYVYVSSSQAKFIKRFNKLAGLEDE